jgi:putative flippase GtrA
MQGAITSLLSLWHRFTLTRYFAASMLALGFDLASFWLLVQAGSNAAVASAASYSLGIVIHWMISADHVFIGKKREGAALHMQRALFAGSALLGLAITVAVVAAVTSAGSSPLIAKGAAVGISFFAVYAVRKWGVFR